MTRTNFFISQRNLQKLKKNSKNENFKAILRQKIEKNRNFAKNPVFSQIFAILASKKGPNYNNLAVSDIMLKECKEV